MGMGIGGANMASVLNVWIDVLGFDGRNHFQTINTSLRGRSFHKEKGQMQNFYIKKNRILKLNKLVV